MVFRVFGLNDVYYVCTVYCGDRYFRIRLFDLDWTEFEYHGKAKNYLGCNPLSSIRFFQAFTVQFIPATVCNINPFLLDLQLHLYGIDSNIVHVLIVVLDVDYCPRLLPNILSG